MIGYLEQNLFQNNILKNNYKDIDLTKIQNLYRNDKINLIKNKSEKILNVIKESYENPSIFKTSSLIVGTILSPIIFKGIITCIGFNSIGILKYSMATKIMASYGGLVTKGSICAILQSIGSSGLGIKSIIATGSIGYLTINTLQNNRIPESHNIKDDDWY